jgi:hypothetical protein
MAYLATVSDLVEVTGLSDRQVRRLLCEGKTLHGRKVNGVWEIPEDEVYRWLSERDGIVAVVAQPEPPAPVAIVAQPRPPAPAPVVAAAIAIPSDGHVLTPSPAPVTVVAQPRLPAPAPVAVVAQPRLPAPAMPPATVPSRPPATVPSRPPALFGGGFKLWLVAFLAVAIPGLCVLLPFAVLVVFR